MKEGRPRAVLMGFVATVGFIVFVCMVSYLVGMVA